MTSSPEYQTMARTPLAALQTPYPHAAGHTALGPKDTDVTPQLLHPAFHGSLDWHSSAHMKWSLVQLLIVAPGQLGELLVTKAVAELDSRLTPGAITVELAYLVRHPSYERPYGWAWAAMLCAAVRACRLPPSRRWQGATAPLADAIADLVLDWLPRQAYPVRHGVHSNTAFALALTLEAYRVLDRPDVVDAIRSRALAWFADDTAYDTRWEPSGSDFLSPALSEVELMRAVLPAAELMPWLERFLPGLGSGGCGDCMATHWLVSFALLAESCAPETTVFTSSRLIGRRCRPGRRR